MIPEMAVRILREHNCSALTEKEGIYMKITEKAAYLKGLSEGLGISDKEPTGKIIGELIELVGAMAEQIDVLSSECKELREYVEELDEDLASVEEDIYEDEDGEFSDDEDDELVYDDDDEDANFYEATCPSCGEVVCFDDTLDPESITCPACGEKFSCVCDGDCSGCGSDCDKDE